MGLWSDLFKRAAHDDGAVLAPGRNYSNQEEEVGSIPMLPKFPNLGEALLVSNNAPLPLSTIVGAGGRPTVALIYSNC